MIFVHFDVIANPAENVGSRQPSPEGRRLWNALFEMYKGRMVILADDGEGVDGLPVWLKTEGFKASYIHIIDDFVRDGVSARANAVWSLMSTVGKPLWYLDTDASCCAEVLRFGVPTLLVAVPSVQRPEWHESEPVRSWDLVVEELNKQALKKAEKAWGDL